MSGWARLYFETEPFTGLGFGIDFYGFGRSVISSEVDSKEAFLIYLVTDDPLETTCPLIYISAKIIVARK